MATIKLTSAQQSALEVAGVAVDPDEGQEPLARAWDGGRLLRFEEIDRMAILKALWEESNAQDWLAEDKRNGQGQDERRMARGARTALSNLADKVREGITAVGATS